MGSDGGGDAGHCTRGWPDPNPPHARPSRTTSPCKSCLVNRVLHPTHITQPLSPCGLRNPPSRPRGRPLRSSSRNTPRSQLLAVSLSRRPTSTHPITRRHRSEYSRTHLVGDPVVDICAAVTNSTKGSHGIARWWPVSRHLQRRNSTRNIEPSGRRTVVACRTMLWCILQV